MLNDFVQKKCDPLKLMQMISLNANQTTQLLQPYSIIPISLRKISKSLPDVHLPSPFGEEMRITHCRCRGFANRIAPRDDCCQQVRQSINTR